MLELVHAGHLPDYACLIVGANMGVVGMCKEHLGVALALKVPVFFVITKVDICPEHILKATVQVGARAEACAQCFVLLASVAHARVRPQQGCLINAFCIPLMQALTTILRKPGVKKKPFLVCLRL